MPSFFDRLSNAWNAFANKDPTKEYAAELVPPGAQISTYRPDRPRLTRGNDKTLVNSIYTRIAMDVAAVNVLHVKLDSNGRYIKTMDSSLNNCLTLDANRDQTGRAFMQDVVMSMFDEGCVAIVPVDTNVDPENADAFQIETMRTGKILEWRPKYVKVRVYNENIGKTEDLMLSKHMVAIVENPLYSVMNQPNSTLKRLVHKLNLLDAVDEQTSSGKLDLIIQLPYAVKTTARKEQADQRKKDIEAQLTDSKYGIAYIDSTEHITQLNRSLENNLLKQVEYLTTELYSQLGLTAEVFNGTAKEEEMLNYYNRTIEPILSAITDEMKRKFLTRTARTQGQSIYFYRDPFRLVPVNQLAEIADKFTRNEIMTSNEIRQIIGMKPAEDPNADQLRNSNIAAANDNPQAAIEQEVAEEEGINENPKNELEEEEPLQEKTDIQPNGQKLQRAPIISNRSLKNSK